MTDANVVHLNKVAPQHPPISPVGRLPVALTQVRDKAAQQLKQALQGLFDSADDSLFEMADRATSNVEQNAFFEAMRDLRLKRKTIERGFLQKIFESFATLNQYEIGKAPLLDAVSFDGLSLVQEEQLEEAVAVDAMVSKVLNRDGVALGHLTTRLNALDFSDAIANMTRVRLPCFAHNSTASANTRLLMCGFNSCSGITSTCLPNRAFNCSISGRRCRNKS